MLGAELLHAGGGAGEERGATADRGAEGLAEMAERGVADFGGGFGDIVAAFEEQFGGAFHPDLAEILRDGHADFLGEKAAEVERTATDLRAEGFDVGWLGKMAAEDGSGALDPFLGNTLLALAEKFGLRRGLKKNLGEELESLGLVPELLRSHGDGRLAQ